MASIPHPKIRTSDHTPSSVPILLLVPKSLLRGVPITATAQDLHHAQYLQPQKSHPDQTISPPKKSSTLHHVAILVPHYELVMKSCKYSWQMLKHIIAIVTPTLKTRITGL